MPPSHNSLQNALLNRAWTQWIALGADATGEPETAVVDPEALIALTAEVGNADARLRDVSTDWCVAYGRYINGSRLKQVVRELRTPAGAIGEYVATVAVAGGPKWPMATEPRAHYSNRGKARLEVARSRSQVRIRLRAAFGVNARADVLAALLAAPPTGLSVADLARVARFTKPNIAFAVDALVLAGLLEARAVGNERRAFLPKGAVVLPGLRQPVRQPDWVARFGVALEAYRFSMGREMSPSVRAVGARQVIEDVGDWMASEGVPQPSRDAVGVDFGGAYDRWVLKLVDWLRSPSGP